MSAMRTYGLGEWVDRKFEIRDDRLVTAEELWVNLELEHRRLELEYEQRERELEELSDEYRDLIERGAEKPEAERDSFVMRANKTEKQYEQSKQQRHANAVRLTALILIQALRETGEGVPSPEDAELPIREAYEASCLPSESFDEYIAIVAKVTELGDLLSWVDYSEPRIWEDPIDPSPSEPIDGESIDEILERFPEDEDPLDDGSLSDSAVGTEPGSNVTENDVLNDL